MHAIAQPLAQPAIREPAAASNGDAAAAPGCANACATAGPAATVPGAATAAEVPPPFTCHAPAAPTEVAVDGVVVGETSPPQPQGPPAPEVNKS